MSSLRFQLPNSLNLFFIIFAILWTYHEAARDTLKLGDTLNSSSSLVSAKGKFTMRFYVNDENSNSSYLATWQTGSRNHAWIANRYTPVLYPSGVLTLDMNKTLKIMHKGGDPVVLFRASETNSIHSTSSVVATLLDSGNFIVQELNYDGTMRQVLWQSFDYPTDTLLPGMKVGVNHKNGHIWFLSAWSGEEQPAPGPFTLDWDPSGRELKIKRRAVVYWTSGIFRDGQFEFMKPYDELGTLRYKFSIVSNENEDYFTYTSASVNQSYGPQWVLNIFGRLLDLNGNVIAPADQCYGFTTDGGCQRRDYPSCRHIGDTFVEKNGFFRSLTSNMTTKHDSNTSLTIGDCKAACWEDCDCLGFITLFKNQTGCKFWVGNWTFSSRDLFGYANPRIFVLSGLSRNDTNRADTNSADTTNEESDTNSWIWIGTSIAAALLLMVLCILCYLLRRRKSLLSDTTRRMLLDWNKRFSIIEGIAQGLLYLHKYSRVRVIHRDLKASNILLDENMIPRISDFGLARIFMHDEPEANTHRVVGTHGYMSPEYAMEGIFSTKSDVYSFGVLMLEIISGRKSSSFNDNDHVLNIVGYAWELWKQGLGLQLMDPTLCSSYIEDQLLRCFHVGLLCVEEKAVDRPTMSDVISMLTNEGMSPPAPTKPAFCTGRKVVGNGKDGNRSESVNDISDYEFEGR